MNYVVIIHKLRKLPDNYSNVLLAYPFGFQAKGVQTVLSDAYITVVLKERSLDEMSKIRCRMARALGIPEDKVYICGSVKYIKVKEFREG